MAIGRRVLLKGGSALLGAKLNRTAAENAVSVAEESVRRNTSQASPTSVSVIDFGARGDGAADDTKAIQAALDSGSTQVLIPGGTYLVTGLEIKRQSRLREILTEGFPTLRLLAQVDAVALKVNKRQFVRVGDLCYSSSGSKDDSFRTVGLHVSQRSYMRFGHQRFENFSAAGLLGIQCVYLHIEEVSALNCKRGISIQKDTSGNPSVHFSIGRSYISGCTRGVEIDTAVNAKLGELVLEYCGASSAADGALHITNSRVQIDMLYCEENERNLVLIDTLLQLGGPYLLEAHSPNLISYRDVGFKDRGIVSVGYGRISTPRIEPDSFSGRDLEIGENLIVPVRGGSVRWGTYSVERHTGKAVSGSWTTIKELLGQEGDGAMRMSYRYEVYVGRSDRTNGYDKGSIMNGQLYSDAHTNPRWLRVHGSSLQVNVNSSGYGLDWGLTLLTSEPIGGA